MNGSVSYEGHTLLSGAINVNTGGNIEALDVEINENGDRTITAPAGVDGYNPINITTNVPQQEPVLDDITITENGTYTPPTGTDGYNEINVNVPQQAPVLDDITITENGTYTPPAGTDGYNEINVNVSGGTPNIQSLTTTISGNGTTVLHAADANCDGFDPVTIITAVPTFTVTQIATSLELTNEVTVNYNTANQLQSGHNYIIIANTDLGVRSAIFTFNGSTNVVDLLDLGGRFTINMSTSSCYWDWNSGGASWCSINVFELISPLLPTHS